MVSINSAPPLRENLWAKKFRDFWSDPANVIGPPGALARRIFKLLWLALAIYILVWVAAPLQVESWQLWMENDELAARVGWSLTLASALCFAVVRYAAEATKPFRIPLLVPIVEFEEKKYKGWSVKPAHLHLPVPTVLAGAAMVIALFGISLLGLWNYYLHEQQTAGGASVAAISGSTDRVAEAQRALEAHDVSAAAALAIVDQGIRETSAGSPTGRSRLVRQRTELMTQSAATRERLQAELREARSATVQTHQTFTDPRPVDAQMAGVTGWGRPVTASALDLLRSAVIEVLLILGAGLGMIGATSRIGVPAGGDVRESFDAETVAPTTVRPEEEPPPPAPAKRRYTLPCATEVDYARASAVGPNEAASPYGASDEETPLSDDPGAINGTSDEAEDEIDPLAAAHLNPNNEEQTA